MGKEIIVNTGSSAYLYSCVKKQLFTLSPVMEQIIRLGDEAIEKKEELGVDSTLQIKGVGEIPVGLYKQYMGKYRMFKAFISKNQTLINIFLRAYLPKI